MGFQWEHIVTEGVAMFADGTTKKFRLSYEDFMRMFRDAKLDGRQVAWIEISSKHSDKGPNRIRFS